MSKGALSRFRRVIIQPDEGVEPVVRLIQAANKSLRIKQFNFTDPHLLEAVKAAHGRGVSVRVMVNPKRSSGSRANDESFNWLRDAGIDIKWTSSRFVVTHEKSMLVDDEFALIATFNFAEKYFTQTRDYGVLVDDPVQIGQIRDAFEADWEEKEFIPDDSSGLLWSNINARRVICGLIDSATETLEIQHPKIVEAVVVDRIAAACARGVRVRFLCGGKHGISDFDVLDTFSSLRLLRRLGVHVHKQKNFRLHAKLIVVDKKVVQTGSMNLDRSAFDLRRELGIVLHDKHFVTDLSAMFEHDWGHSSAYEAPDPISSEPHPPEHEFPHDPELIHE